MVVTLGMLGLRIAEMSSLNVESIQRNVGQATLTFIGKGGGRHTVDLPLEVLTAFDVIAAGRTEGPLFLNRNGSRWMPSDIRRHLTVLARDAGITTPITPHGLRRTAAKTLAERGQDLGSIQEFLRHRDPRTSKQHYIGNDTGASSLARQTLASVYANVAR